MEAESTAEREGHARLQLPVGPPREDDLGALVELLPRESRRELGQGPHLPRELQPAAWSERLASYHPGQQSTSGPAEEPSRASVRAPRSARRQTAAQSPADRVGPDTSA